MKMSQLLAPTLRETPAEAEIVSHQLLLRAGYIRRVSPGAYDLLPLMWRVVRKVEQIVREEMDRAGAQELLMPILIPAELWEESGRLAVMGTEMMRVKNRHDRWEVLGPTHEEVITEIARAALRSYRQLPINLYQINTKFRDEIRPRFGLMRGREFRMKDAYSFHVDTESLEATYQVMCEAYTRIFERCGLTTRKVESDVGAIGGSAAHEFMVVVETSGGENRLLFCDRCDYAANVERAESRMAHPVAESPRPARVVDTPGTKSIQAVSEFLKVSPDRTVKTLVYRYAKAGDPEAHLAAVLIRGDLEVNPVALANVLDAVGDVVPAAASDLGEAFPPGYLGPRGMAEAGIRVLGDLSVKDLTNFVVGANQPDRHEIDANWGPSLPAPGEWHSLREARAGERCARCDEGHLLAAKGIEVGNTFKLGTKYSKAMGALFADQDGADKPFVMGCYGIGTTRTAQAAVEAFHDADGICWPVAIAPYHLVVVPVNTNDPQLTSVANQLYQEAQAAGLEAVIDDRDERPGVKFKDADLLGFPLRITVGKGVKDGQVELRFRRDGVVEAVPIAEAVSRARAYVTAGGERKPELVSRH